jgi:threonine-phosphate decarboxylase
MKQNTVKFEHGGDIYTDGLLIGKELIDFSSNINPLGVPESFTNHIDEAVKALNRYPDIEYRELKNAICTYINKSHISEENIVLGNGAAEIIDLAIGSFKDILLTVPSFGEYEKSALKADVKINYSYLKEDMHPKNKNIRNLDIDYEDLLGKVKELNIEALVLANPNNPNGGIIDKSKFQAVTDICKSKGITIIIDEAFIEFTGCNSDSFIDELECYPNIFIIRALTKFFALPGIRFGYGVSKDLNLLESIKKKQNPWNINCFAEVAAKYVLKDKEYIEESLKWISEELPYLSRELKDISIIEQVYKSKSNFILCKLKGISDVELYAYCMKNGIAIRRASNFKGLDDSFVRFAVKDRNSNDRLIEVLTSFNKQNA